MSARDSVDETTYWQGEIEKTKKAFGGCEKCYGKGYSTVADKVGSTRMNTCTCDRGKQLDKTLDDMHKATLWTFIQEMEANLPEYIEEKYPKAQNNKKTKGRGEATVAITMFLLEVRKALKMKV